MSKLNIPFRLGYWIKSFLQDRNFCVKVENSSSKYYDIKTGVSQGSSLSPIVFLIIINDIIEINRFPNYKINSLLFAGDIFSFSKDKNINRLQIQMQRYLKELENWFKKLRLSIAPNKCFTQKDCLKK